MRAARAAGVFGLCVVGIDATDVAAADRSSVVALDMRADLSDWTPRHDPPVAVDDIVITDVRPSALFVPRPDILDCKALSFASAEQCQISSLIGRAVSRSFRLATFGGALASSFTDAPIGAGFWMADLSGSVFLDFGAVSACFITASVCFPAMPSTTRP